ncbi:MAG: glycosyltransferase [Patescibacteria group bacterium]|nr:glycosyltransferase [Patescibacteria group bacterium]
MMQVILAHDSFTQLGGAERIMDVLHEMFPGSPVYSLVLDRQLEYKYRDWDIRTSWLQIFFNFFPRLQYFLPIIPLAVQSIKINSPESGENTIVFSNSSSWIKNIRVARECAHINYCHTPPRFLWTDADYVDQETPKFLRPLVRIIVRQMRKWDYRGAQRVNYFLANSQEVQKRIKAYYNRDSEVLYPFVDTEFWRPANAEKSDYFLIVSRLQAHKKTDLIVKIFNELNIPLHIVGTGRQENYLKSIARGNVKFLGKVPDEQLREEYSKALGVIFPQKEDFGLIPLEAAACGTATLAYAKGGALETVIPGLTGEFFDSYDPSLIKEKILSWDYKNYSSDALRSQAEKFSKEKFKKQVLNIISQRTNDFHGRENR